MLTVLLIAVHQLRSAVPVVGIIGTAPTYFTLWCLMRAITVLFPKHLFRICDDYMYSVYQRLVLFYFENWANVDLYLHGDYEQILERKENVLFICNHQSSVDWLIVNMLAVRQGSLGHIRYVLKEDLKWIPLYGWYFWQHGCVYVKRNAKVELDTLRKRMSKIKQGGLPVWLVIFPEGTRYSLDNNNEAIQRSKMFSDKRGLVPFEHVLYPRSGATVAALDVLRANLDAVYDVTVMYSDTYDNENQRRLSAPSMPEYCEGKSSSLHLHIKRIPINNIPLSVEQVSSWLYDRFVEKDRILGQFYEYAQSSSFKSSDIIIDETDRPLRVTLPLKETFFACTFISMATAPFLLTSQGRQMYWKIWAFGTPICYLWMKLFSKAR